MRIADLFCGAGGAALGMLRLGAAVVGVDINDQPNYPGEFIKGNALDFDLRGFDFVWASPPCQAFTAYRRTGNVSDHHLNMIPETRHKLIKSGVPYVIENVEGAREHLKDPVRLCGSSFGLDVRRHRLFECSFEVSAPSCQHKWQKPRFTPASNRKNRRSTVEVGVWRIPLAVQRVAMGIEGMSVTELSQAIPPAYSEFLLRAYLNAPRFRFHLTVQDPSMQIWHFYEWARNEEEAVCRVADRLIIHGEPDELTEEERALALDTLRVESS